MFHFAGKGGYYLRAASDQACIYDIITAVIIDSVHDVWASLPGLYLQYAYNYRILDPTWVFLLIVAMCSISNRALGNVLY